MREKTGGFEPRFWVTRADGKPCRAEARYLVLDYAGDPHAKAALAAYADSIASENPRMAADLRDALVNPTSYPAQHRDAHPLEKTPYCRIMPPEVKGGGVVTFMAAANGWAMIRRPGCIPFVVPIEDWNRWPEQTT